MPRKDYVIAVVNRLYEVATTNNIDINLRLAAINTVEDINHQADPFSPPENIAGIKNFLEVEILAKKSKTLFD